MRNTPLKAFAKESPAKSPLKHWGHYPGGDYDHSIADHAKERVEEAKTYVKEKTEEAKEDPISTVSSIYKDHWDTYTKPYEAVWNWAKKK
jgi:hypothetical protein